MELQHCSPKGTRVKGVTHVLPPVQATFWPFWVFTSPIPHASNFCVPALNFGGACPHFLGKQPPFKQPSSISAIQTKTNGASSAFQDLFKGKLNISRKLLVFACNQDFVTCFSICMCLAPCHGFVLSGFKDLRLICHVDGLCCLVCPCSLGF